METILHFYFVFFYWEKPEHLEKRESKLGCMGIKLNSNLQIQKCNYLTQWLHDRIMLMHDRTTFLSVCGRWSKVPYNIIHNEKLEYPGKLLDTQEESGNFILCVGALNNES